MLDEDIQILLNTMPDKSVLEWDEEVEPSDQQLLDGLLDGPLDGLLTADNSFIMPNTSSNLQHYPTTYCGDEFPCRTGPYTNVANIPPPSGG